MYMRFAIVGALFVVFCMAMQPYSAMATGTKTPTSENRSALIPESKKESPKDAGKDTKADLEATEESAAYHSITLRGLNKVTARSSTIEGPIGTVMRFGNLEMVASRCWQSPPEEQPENAALLEISELKPKQSPERIFAGWMFSSSPGLSALQHAVYDITVVSCNTLQSTSAEPPSKPTVNSTPDSKITPQTETIVKPEDETDLSENPLD
jgi:hypothetical protein